MIGRIEQYWRFCQRWLSHSAWAIRLLRLPVSTGTRDAPGLVLLQIDGLSRREMEHAVERGRLPFLRQLLRREHYALLTFYPGLPTTTPAVQAELYYDVRCAVPAFSFLDRPMRRVFTMFNPRCASAVEEKLRLHGEGLLQGGSSWSNIYTGGAAPEESHYCAASAGFGHALRSRPLLQFLTFPILHFPSLLRIALLLLIECGLALWDMLRGVLAGRSLPRELLCLPSRVFVSIGLREIVTMGAKIDVARGLPIVHVNFVGYDEQAHARGPSSAFAHWSLLGIDRAIRSIYCAARLSERRDYQVWIFSDHGQEATKPFSGPRGEGLEDILHAALDASGAVARRARPQERLSRAYLAGGLLSRRRRARSERVEALSPDEEKSFVLAAMGPVGHLYLQQPTTIAQKRALAARLLRDGRVPVVLLRDETDEVEWIDAQGGRTLWAAVDSFPHPADLKPALVADLAALCQHTKAGDLVLLAWHPTGLALSFANERGAHAGLGPNETQGFIIMPEQVRLPVDGASTLRPSEVRAAALHYLGRQPLPAGGRVARSQREHLRIMTYNVHGCFGMDGRISPARIAQVIARYDPDVVALQELDLGRARSQRHDQPKLIADLLGMQMQFCPTVIENDEQYGHAIFSHFPMELVRVELLPFGASFRRYAEPRGALWVRVQAGPLRVNFLNTHFGLRHADALAQTNTLLGPDWLGELASEEPVVVCGDFNMAPFHPGYRRLAARLRDVQCALPDHAPASTFATFRPWMRIDHIFVSPHFRPERIAVPRNDLTRVASDHLPLIVDLTYEPWSECAPARVVPAAAAAGDGSPP